MYNTPKLFYSIASVILLFSLYVTNAQSISTIDPCLPSYLRIQDNQYAPEVLQQLTSANVNFDTISAGIGPYHFDETSIKVRMPNDVSPEDFLYEMRRNLNQAVGNPDFDDFVRQVPRRKSGEPQIGDIYDVDLSFPEGLGLPITVPSIEDGSVILTDIGDTYYIMTTITNPDDFIEAHPTPGTREWGFERNDDGTVTFYTRGVSRIGSYIEAFLPDAAVDLGIQLIHEIQADAWRSMIVGIGRKIETLGGTREGIQASDSIEFETPPTCATNLLDLVFVIDTTGSMANDIAEVQNRALDIINQVAASGSDWQIAIVTYRDHPQAPYGDPGDYVSRVEVPFSSDQNAIIAAINGIIVGGGGDGPEAVYAGLMQAIGQDWRNGARKVVVLMGDAPPHDPDPILGYTSETVLQAAYDVDPASIFPILITDQNAVRYPFQVLADGSSGRIFYAANATEVVPTILSTISVATGVQLSVGLEVQVASLEPAFPMRAAPTMSAAVVANLPRSERAVITEGPQVVFDPPLGDIPQHFIWWKIRTASGQEGWIQETYYGEPILIPFSASNPLTPVDCTLTTRGDVNIRSGPGTEYQQIASRAGAGNLLAANGQYGDINNPQAHWWQLINGFWIRNDQVTEAGNCPALPVVTP